MSSLILIYNGDVMKKHYTVIILDESGSMGSMREEAIDACNQQIRDIRKNVEGEVFTERVGLVKFSSAVERTEIWDMPIGKVRNLQKKDYKPMGMTAMLDAVGLAIDSLLKLDDINDEETSVLINIISDGEENNSKEYNYQTIASKIKELQDTGRWTFTYSGANQDLSKLSEKLHIPVGNMQRWTATAKGLEESTRGRSKSYDTYFISLKSKISDGDKKFSSSEFFSS